MQYDERGTNANCLEQVFHAINIAKSVKRIEIQKCKIFIRKKKKKKNKIFSLYASENFQIFSIGMY